MERKVDSLDLLVITLCAIGVGVAIAFGRYDVGQTLGSSCGQALCGAVGFWILEFVVMYTVYSW